MFQTMRDESLGRKIEHGKRVLQVISQVEIQQVVETVGVSSPLAVFSQEAIELAQETDRWRELGTDARDGGVPLYAARLEAKGLCTFLKSNNSKRKPNAGTHEADWTNEEWDWYYNWANGGMYDCAKWWIDLGGFQEPGRSASPSSSPDLSSSSRVPSSSRLRACRPSFLCRDFPVGFSSLRACVRTYVRTTLAHLPPILLNHMPPQGFRRPVSSP